MHARRSTVVGWLAIAVLCGAPGPTLAGTTGQLLGGVTSAGEALPGVTVTASSPVQIGGLQQTQTDLLGAFQFPRLAPGEYVVRFELDGFLTQELAEIQVRLDRATELRVILAAGEFGDEVDVIDRVPVVDTKQVSIVQNFTAEYIRQTRTNWEGLILQSAGTSSDEYRRMLGSTPQDNTFLVDGFDTTNWFQRSPNPVARELPFDAVQEVALHTAGFEAEFGHATGGVLNVVTKSGGNRFAGSLDLRYSDNGLATGGDHFDPDEQPSESRDLAGTLGGPILRDQLWFFSSIRDNFAETTFTGSPAPSVRESDYYLLKLSWQSSDSWSFVGKYSGAPTTRDNPDFEASPFRAEEATSVWEDAPWQGSFEAVGQLGRNVLLEVRAGTRTWGQTILPSDGDLSTIGHFNLDTQESFGNYEFQFYSESTTRDIEADTTWFVDSARGSHEIQVGIGFGQPRASEDFCTNGSGARCAPGVDGYFFRDVSDAAGGDLPLGMEVKEGSVPLEYEGNHQTLYLQDAWRPRENLTLQIGLRWDDVSYDNAVGDSVAALSKIQPRIGAAWDVTGDGRTMARASWGRFMHPANMILSAFTSASSGKTEFWLSCAMFISADPQACAAVADQAGLGYRADPETWAPAGWFLPPTFVAFATPAQTIDDLATAYADEWVIGVERELFRRTSLELSYISKDHANLFDDTCEGNYPEPSADASCDFFLVANMPAVKMDYEAWMLRFESRAHARFHFLASWVYSESKGSLDFNTAATGGFDLYPYHFENRYGYLPDHSRHRLKLNGFVLLPYDFSVALYGWWDSELRWTPTDSNVPGMDWGELFLEPRGNRKTGARHRFDLQAAKGLKVGPTRLVLIGKVINLFDSENLSAVCANVTGCGSADSGSVEMGSAIRWQRPRSLELGLRVEF